MSNHAFLTGHWLNLVMLNYEADPALLDRLAPRGTEPDLWNGKAYASLVGFEFRAARLHGWYIPFHQNFEELNLRYYVRHRTAEGWRRGVVFVKQFAPRPAVALVARWCYNQNFHAVRMRREIQRASPDAPPEVAYYLRHNRQWATVRATGVGTAARPGRETLDEFIVEHYWAYCGQRDGSTLEYKVEHPPWRVWQAINGEFTGDVAQLYGESWMGILGAPPVSALIAEGSAVGTYKGRNIQEEN